MKTAFTSFIFLILLQHSVLHATVVDEDLRKTIKSLCRHPLRFITIGTLRIPCDPEPDPGYLPECAKCSSSRQCLQPKCWGGKCTDGSDASLRRCFLPECARCTSSLQCSTKKCWGGKCVYDTTASKNKCFPHLLKPECASCSSGSECRQGKCWGSKCTDGSDASLRRCFYPECHSCTRATQCSTKKCWGGKCVYNTQASKDKCFPYHPDPCHLLRQAVTDPEEVARIRRECP